MCKRVKTGRIIDLSKELKPEELRLFYEKASQMDHSVAEHTLWVVFQNNPDRVVKNKPKNSE
ncbi:MAG: hypothetical protein AAF546_01380 [Verrucomicrobiota bacterium]